MTEETPVYEIETTHMLDKTNEAAHDDEKVEAVEPVAPNPILNISIRNLNVKGASGKDGMKYTLTCEIGEDDFDNLRSMPLAGMTCETEMEITHINENLFSENETAERETAVAKSEHPYHDKSIGPICQEIIRDYCPAPQFQDFCADVVWADKTKSSAHWAGDAVKRWIGFKSRKSVDYDDKAKEMWFKMLAAYRVWRKEQKQPDDGQHKPSDDASHISHAIPDHLKV